MIHTHFYIFLTISLGFWEGGGQILKEINSDVEATIPTPAADPK